MLNDYITYDQEFLNNVLRNLTRNKYLGIEEKCILLEEQNKSVLERIISLYQNLCLEENNQVIVPQILSAKEVSKLANDIFIFLLPTCKSKILEYDDLLYTYSDFSFQESCYCYDISEENKVIPIEIQIPEKMTEYSAGIINHEKTHTLVMDSIFLNQFPGMYLELLSMLIQKITNYEVERYFKIKTTHIIDDVVRTIDNSSHISVLDVLKDINLEVETINNRFVYHYLNLKANDYLISDWYSDLLFQSYILEPERIKKELEQVFSNQISLQQMLDNHQLNLQNSLLIPTIQNKIETSKKYSITR